MQSSVTPHGGGEIPCVFSQCRQIFSSKQVLFNIHTDLFFVRELSKPLALSDYGGDQVVTIIPIFSHALIGSIEVNLYKTLMNHVCFL